MQHLSPHARLGALLHARMHLPFDWGERDCALLAFDAAHVQTDRDSFADLRGAYRNRRGALRRLRAAGGLAALAARIGPEIGAAEVRDGDVALLSAEICAGGARAHGALGVAWRDGVWAQGADGLVIAPLSAAQRWWRAV